MGQETLAMEGRLARVRESVSAAAREVGRDPQEITVIAVSKRKPLTDIVEAFDSGVRHFGESQVQEAMSKIPKAPAGIHWHFIGHLQKNKVRPAVGVFEFIHSIDSLSVLRRVDRIAGEEGRHIKLFLQVNLVSDPDKHGLDPDAVASVLDAAFSCANVTCLGLMGIPPFEYSIEETQRYFFSLKDLRDRLKGEWPQWPGWLSFGMTRDFVEAVRWGSDFVRVGTAIFGERS